MMRRLKTKFLLLSGISLFLLLATIVTVMNVINYTAVVQEADEILALLSQNKGSFEVFEDKWTSNPGDTHGGSPRPPAEQGNRLPPHLSPELPYESRYFSVLLDEYGNAVLIDIGKIAAVDSGRALAYAKAVDSDHGFADDFRYVRSVEDHNVRITFLDFGRQLAVFRDFLLISICIALGGFVLVLAVIFFCAGRIIRPIAESYEKQKRFITDAGHEIKTPLTIIRANADLLEMELGEHESLSDIKQQAERLTVLTNDLVYLSRMEEAETDMQVIDFPISEIVSETALPFKAPALAQEKAFDCQIQPMLSIKGNAKAIGQLVSVLMDNALKYSPQGGKVALALTKQNRTVTLTVTNTTATPVDREALPRLFDRFYRTDRSRNSATGGHGIGLSVAKAIVTAHGGKIHAFAMDDHTFGITAVFSA